MIVDARSIEADTVVEVDVCIVGGGLAGIALAKEFMNTPVEVCLLESGGLQPDSETQSLDAGENIGYPYYPLETARVRCLGGSSTLWHTQLADHTVGARLRPLDPIDFEERDWVPHSGWPFRRCDLEAYYDRAQAVCRVGPATFDVQDWADPDRRPEARLEGDEVQTIVYKLCPKSLFAGEYRKVVSSAENVTTCLHANVLEIEASDAADHVARLRAATLKGNEFFVSAKIYVLAAGGIEAPRLMLLSRRQQPAGLGNQHDLVGRFFMEHLHFWSGMLVLPEAHRFDSTAFYNDVHTVKDVAVIGKLALAEHVLRRERLLNQNVQLFSGLRPDPFKYRRLNEKPKNSLRALLRGTTSDIGHDVRNVVTGWDDIARAVARRLRGALPTSPVYIFANMTEQIPNPDSRLTLGRDLDAFGQPRVRLDWKIAPQDISSAIRTQTIMSSALEKIGWGRFYRELVEAVPPEGTHGGYHHMGTTRMHADPRRGVVDPNCRVHGIDNLFIAGPSVFPTGGYANPVLTTLALSLRLADHVKGVLATSRMAA
jgi:choline dehydrogenase-like flavoprotein